MATRHGRRPAAADRRHVPAWDDLPGSMQLLVVKEMTSWQPYKDVVNGRLRLTREQKRRFEALYNATLRKQLQADDVARASVAEQGAIQEQQEHHRGIPGRMGSSSSSSSSRPVVAMIKDRVLLERAADTFPVAPCDIALAQAFLRSIGVVRRAADLGHWLGHSGCDRFVIDRDTHVLCPAGTHAAPDAEATPQRSYCPAPSPVPTAPEEGTRRAETPSVPLAVPLLPLQRRRRVRPRRLHPMSDARRQPGNSGCVPGPVHLRQEVNEKEDMAVPDFESAGDRVGADETGEPSALQSPPITTCNDSLAELARADRINCEAAALLAKYRYLFARPTNKKEKTEDSDEDYIE